MLVEVCGLRLMEAVSGGGEHSQVEGCGLRKMEAVPGGLEQLLEEGAF